MKHFNYFSVLVNLYMMLFCISYSLLWWSSFNRMQNIFWYSFTITRQLKCTNKELLVLILKDMDFISIRIPVSSSDLIYFHYFISFVSVAKIWLFHSRLNFMILKWILDWLFLLKYFFKKNVLIILNTCWNFCLFDIII